MCIERVPVCEIASFTDSQGRYGLRRDPWGTGHVWRPSRLESTPWLRCYPGFFPISPKRVGVGWVRPLNAPRFNLTGAMIFERLERLLLLPFMSRVRLQLSPHVSSLVSGIPLLFIMTGHNGQDWWRVPSLSQRLRNDSTIPERRLLSSPLSTLNPAPS